MIENYKQSSAAGVSILFLAVWMLGDITNLIGSLWADLVPTVTALAIYFCFADTVLILQCLYYNTLNARAEKRRASQAESGEPSASETDALIQRSRSYSGGGVTAENLGLPGSRRKSKTSQTSRRDSLSQMLEEDTPRRAWLKNTVSIVLIVLAGAAGWALAWRAGAWKPTPVASGPEEEVPAPIGAQIMGYASAVLYLGWVQFKRC